MTANKIEFFSDIDIDSTELNLSQKTYYALKKMILKAELPFDKPISQLFLAEKLGVSRTPLREALNKLLQEHLIFYETNKRIIIPSYTPDEVDQLMGMRIMLECLAIRITASTIRIGDVEEIKAAYERMESSFDSPTIEDHNHFHDLLVNGAGSYLIDEIRKLQEQAIRCQLIYMDNFSPEVHDHLPILEAMVEQDPIKASNALSNHYANVAFSVLGQMDPLYEPIAVRQALRLNTIR